VKYVCEAETEKNPKTEISYNVANLPKIYANSMNIEHGRNSSGMDVSKTGSAGAHCPDQ